MKKAWTVILACIMVVGMTAGTAAAKSDKALKAEQAEAKENKAPAKQEQKAKQTEDKPDKKAADTKTAKAAKETETETVTTATYKRHGYNGLLVALENVKDKPAGAVLADLLLTKYDAQLTPEIKAELEQIQSSKEALQSAADLLAEAGSVTDAVYVQQEVILADVTDLKSYKKLNELSKKAGFKTGSALFVNGEEYENADPVFRQGSTLVAFRSVAEALDAQVTYNAADQSITVTRDGVTVKLYLNSKKAFVNNKAVLLQTAASAENGTTLVPVRFISEALGATVKFEADSKSVVVYEEAAE
ncbi:copper amine oxidase N-terminal domain-containing protein [Paenibacillus caui]|uniref:copper amine oxidase N-terminal domain-containing protein n=1 Tax=Paenibacillus caui TaxID=2873927 RepID=UPI001CA82E08|nr:copper amine oxidase N-terminal domain-containing protein [Paenibacillus caui]